MFIKKLCNQSEAKFKTPDLSNDKPSKMQVVRKLDLDLFIVFEVMQLRLRYFLSG